MNLHSFWRYHFTATANGRARFSTLMLLLLCWLAAAPSHAQAPDWQTLTGLVPFGVAPGSPDLYGSNLVVDATGDVYVTGSFAGQLTLGATTLSCRGGNDVFVAKWRPATNTFLWAQQSGTLGAAAGGALAVAGGKVYVGGGFQGVTPFGPDTLRATGGPHGYVARLDAGTGHIDWATATSGGRNQGVAALAVEGTAVYLTGSFSGGTATFGSHTITNTSTGGGNLFVAKLVDTGAAGHFAWVLSAGSPEGDDARPGLVVSGGQVYFTGEVRGTTAHFGALTFTNAGPVGLADTFVAKVSDAGSSAAFAWVQPLGGSGHDSATGLALASGHLYVTGYSQSRSLQLGAFTLAPQGEFDAFLARLTDTGAAPQVDWAVLLGGAADEYATTLAARGTELYVAGFFYGTGARFGTTTLANASAQPYSSDGFVVRLQDTGTTATVDWAQRGGGSGSEVLYKLGLVGNTLYAIATGDLPTAFGALRLNAAAVATGAYLVALPTARGLAASSASARLVLDVYPTPARTALFVGSPALLPGAELHLLDNLGRLVRHSPVVSRVGSAAGRMSATLDVAGLVPGLYTLLVPTRSGLVSRRVAVE